MKKNTKNIVEAEQPKTRTNFHCFIRLLLRFTLYFTNKTNNYLLKGIYAAIAEETKAEKHENLDMFVLVIMSHGTDGEVIFGSDCQPVKLVKIRYLLSPHKFPAMKGKPKLMIIQACSGSEFI